jgi:hypothetical protein
MDTTTALSRGGKDGLAASPGIVCQGKPALGPTLSPEADRVGVQIDARRNGHVGKRREFVQQQDEVGTLPEMGRSGASADETLRLSEELIGKGRAIAWERSRHEKAPGATRRLFFREHPLTLPVPRISATLQLIAKRTT